MKRIKTTNITFLLLVIAAIFVPLFAGGLFRHLTIHQNMIVSELLYVAVTLTAVWFMDRGLIGQIQQKAMNGRTLLLVLAASLLIQPVVTWLNLFSMLFVKNYVAQTMSAMTGSFWLNLLYVAAAPAIAEEFVFRGVFFHGYRCQGIRRAAVLSGLLFGLLHMNLNQFVYAFALGVILALLVEASGSIYASMTVHFMVNARSVVILALSKVLPAAATGASSELGRTDILYALLIYTPIALGCAVGLFFLLRVIAKGCGRAEYFDLVLQGQERTIRRSACGSERQVRETQQKMRHETAGLLAEDGTEEEKTSLAGTPADRAARFVPEPEKEDETGASLGERLRLYLPVILGVVMCVGYMIWVECFA